MNGTVCVWPFAVTVTLSDRPWYAAVRGASFGNAIRPALTIVTLPAGRLDALRGSS